MKKYYKFFIILLVASFIVPQVAFASWWNPFTWNIFSIFRKPQTTVQTTVTTNPSVSVEVDILSCNGSKYNKCPVGQVFVCPTDGQDAFCDKDKSKEVKNPKTKEQVISTPTVKITKPTQITQKEEIKAENFNFLVVQLNESLTLSFENHLKIDIEFREILQSRRQRSLQLQTEFQGYVVESVPKGVNIPNDMYRGIVAMYGNDAELTRIYISMEDTLIKASNEVISKLRNFKVIESTTFYSREQAIIKMKEVMGVYDTLDLLAQKTRENYDKYLANSEKTDTLIAQAVAALKKNADEYAYQVSLPKEIYQPIQYITLPQIQLPKTTYCHISYTGVHGNYDVTCN
ncbi:hypothetical protein EXS45_02125 [Candidatus Nomurabacteria bacterium]|nr:hypothetical protein [Candidatus Nomurabacteria bacterium]